MARFKAVKRGVSAAKDSHEAQPLTSTPDAFTVGWPSIGAMLQSGAESSMSRHQARSSCQILLTGTSMFIPSFSDCRHLWPPSSALTSSSKVATRTVTRESPPARIRSSATPGTSSSSDAKKSCRFRWQSTRPHSHATMTNQWRPRARAAQPSSSSWHTTGCRWNGQWQYRAERTKLSREGGEARQGSDW